MSLVSLYLGHLMVNAPRWVIVLLESLFIGCVTIPASAGIDVVVSAPTNGISVAVWLVDGGDRLSSDKPITFAFGVGVTNAPVRLFLLRPEFLLEAVLIDFGGNEVAKTDMGRKFGSRFRHLVSGDRDALVLNHKDVPRVTFARPDYNQPVTLVFGKKPVSPDDLFRIPKKGIYRLRLNFQAGQFADGERGSWRRLVFPPLEVPIVKH